MDEIYPPEKIRRDMFKKIQIVTDDDKATFAIMQRKEALPERYVVVRQGGIGERPYRSCTFNIVIEITVLNKGVKVVVHKNTYRPIGTREFDSIDKAVNYVITTCAERIDSLNTIYNDLYTTAV